jgi:hypothetical protein
MSLKFDSLFPFPRYGLVSGYQIDERKVKQIMMSLRTVFERRGVLNVFPVRLRVWQIKNFFLCEFDQRKPRVIMRLVYPATY